MADNATLPATGTVVASDDVSGVQYQRVKLDGGGDGATLPLVALTGPPVPTATALPSREVGQATWAAGFSATQSAIDATFVELRLGSGIGRSQASSNLVLTTGTAINAEYLARSASSFTGALLARCRHTLSQRIVNQNFAVMLADNIGEGLTYTNTATALTVAQTAHGFTAANVGQSFCIGGINATSGAGLPGRYAIASIVDANSYTLTVAGWTAGGGTLCAFGRSFARTLFNGTTATAATFDVANKGWSDTPVNLALNTTATPGHMLQYHFDGRNAFCADSLVASTATANVVTRASRMEFVPDDVTPLFFYIWLYNGSTAPASTTTWTLGACAVEEYANLPVYVAGQRMQGSTAPAPVALINSTVTLTSGTQAAGDFGLQYRTTAAGAATNRHIIAAASTNATQVKASAGRLLGWCVGNTAATWVFLKLHNVSGTPTPGAAVAMTIPIPPNGLAQSSLEGGVAFTTGIGYSITNLAADADTTGIAAAQVVGELFYA